MKAKEIACGNYLRQIAMGFNMYNADNDGYMPAPWTSADDIASSEPYSHFWWSSINEAEAERSAPYYA